MKKFKAYVSLGSLFAIFDFIGLFSNSDIVKTAFADDDCYGSCVDCYMDIPTQTYHCKSVERGWCFCSEKENPSEVCNLSLEKRCSPPN